jgi:hypothetical protein
MSETTAFLNHNRGLIGEPDYTNRIKFGCEARTFWTPDEPGYLQINSIPVASTRFTYVVSAAVAVNPDKLTGANLDDFVENDPETILVGHCTNHGTAWASYDCNLIPIVPGQYIYTTNIAEIDKTTAFYFIPFKK